MALACEAEAGRPYEGLSAPGTSEDSAVGNREVAFSPTSVVEKQTPVGDARGAPEADEVRAGYHGGALGAGRGLDPGDSGGAAGTRPARLHHRADNRLPARSEEGRAAGEED